MLFGHFPQYFCDKSSVNIKRRQALCKTIIHTNILLISVLKLDLSLDVKADLDDEC